MRLIYVGTTPVVFITCGVGEVMPGEEFTVPSEFMDSFIHRTDIEIVSEPVKPVDEPIVKKNRAKASLPTMEEQSPLAPVESQEG